MKSLARGTFAVALVALTSGSANAGEAIAETSAIVTSLIVIAAPESVAAYPLPTMGLARSIAVDPSTVEMPGETAEQKPMQLASLEDSESYAEYRALLALRDAPVPTPRPDISSVSQRPAVSQRRVVRERAPVRSVRVAQAERVVDTAPRKRSLRVGGPLFIGVYR